MANYLFQTASAHYFRRTIPLDLRPAFGIRELCYSLGTIRKRDAKRVARKLAAATSVLFEQTRLSASNEVDRKQVKISLKAYIDQCLTNIPPTSLIQPVAGSNALFQVSTAEVKPRPKAKPKTPKVILLKDVVKSDPATNLWTHS